MNIISATYTYTFHSTPAAHACLIIANGPTEFTALFYRVSAFEFAGCGINCPHPCSLARVRTCFADDELTQASETVHAGTHLLGRNTLLGTQALKYVASPASLWS